MHTDIGSDITVEDTLFAKEIRLLIEMVVSEMPAQRQRIYRMSREQGVSNEEIAGTLGISKRSVENQISLALKEIRQAVTAYVIFCSACYHKLKNCAMEVSMDGNVCT